ncbi:Uncharacterized protein GBIM_17561 [Gryllus bimaculatus]|nr:Uncharacterized protein GBIM_17561 [Gryllus bimaculatus]
MDGPYRATKLWNEMLHTFKHGMPLRRHRRHMKVYENCFSGAEAIQWLQLALKDNPNIKPGISKTQVRQLLNKFMKAGVFSSVCSSDAQEFKENEIYQFSSQNNGFHLLSSHDYTKAPAKTVEVGLQESRKAMNVNKKENVLPANNMPPFLQNSRIPLENCTFKDYNTEMKQVLRRKESFTHMEKPGHILNRCENKIQKENPAFSSQPYDSTRSIPIPPKKPQRRLESCTSLSNTCATNRYDANQNLNIEQKYPQHEARSIPRNTMNSCTHFDRHTHAKSYPSSTHRSPPYESACHMIYEDKLNVPVSYQERTSDLCKFPRRTVNNDTVCMRKTRAVGHNENYQQYPLYTHPGNAPTVVNMEHRPGYPSVPLKPLHSNVIAMHDARGNYDPHSYSHYRRDPAEKIMSDTNSQFSSRENNRYETAKYSIEEKQILNDGYKKLTDIPLGNAAPPGPVNTLVSSSESEIRDAWKMIFILRLETVLAGMEEITSLLPTNFRIDWLIRNVQDQMDTVPRSSSVESGLDEWPEDIINNYREQLSGVKEPLISPDLYSLITEAYLYVEHINNASTQFMCKTRESMLASRSVENLVLGMASPCASDVKNVRQTQNKMTAGSAVYCYETAFASESPITRIVPQSTIKDVYFSRQNTYSRSFRSSRERLPPEEQIRCYDRNVNSGGLVGEVYPPRSMWRSKSSQDMKDAVCSSNVDNPIKEKSHRSGRRWRMTRKLSEAGQKSSGLQHCRNKSGGYVNPALSQSLEDLSSQKFNCEELDYAAALETLQTLMQHTHMTMNDKRNDRVVLQESSCDLSSESGSYYTAASTPDRQKYSNVSLTKEHEQSKWKQPALGLGISVFQLLLLLLSPGSRCLLKRLLRCLHHLPTAINTEEAMQVIQSMTPNVLNNEQENDKAVPYRVVKFLVTFYKEVFEVPVDLQTSVSKHLNQLAQAQRVTYCEQVTNKQFEEQGLSGSQKALSELLEQILSDKRMGEKEKKRKLKLFKERYPNIYKQHFPGVGEDRINSEKSRGILQLPSLGRLKNIRI